MNYADLPKHLRDRVDRQSGTPPARGRGSGGMSGGGRWRCVTVGCGATFTAMSGPSGFLAHDPAHARIECVLDNAERA